MRLAACALAGLTLAAQPVEPFTILPSPAALGETEARLWHEAGEYDQALRKAGFLFPDPAVSAYVQEVTDRLFPLCQGRLRVQVLKDPDVNAFALPNGSIYVNLGLLAQAENEAQLATVLAHEVTHVLARHGYQAHQHVKSNSAFAMTSVLALGPLGLLGALGATSSVYGFSRDEEREADRKGFQALLEQGYDVRESVRIFRILAEDAQAEARKQPVFFASHPKLLDRIASFEEMVAAAPAPADRREEAAYAERTAAARMAWLDEELGRSRHPHLLLVLGRPEASARFGPAAPYYRGRALELRNQPADTAAAEAAYRESMAADPAYAPPCRALGLLLLRRGDRAGARQYLALYLEKAPQAQDAAFIAGYLQQLAPPQEP